MAEQSGISKMNVYNRVFSLGWDLQRAITEPMHKPDTQKMKYVRIAKANGMSSTTFYNRVKAGWDYETAANTPKMTREEVNKRRKDHTLKGVMC